MATLYDPLQSKADTLSSGLQSSSTAYAPNTLPTTRDISEDNQLTSVNKQIEDARSKNLRATWYGNTSSNDIPDTGAPADGIIMSGLKALSRPLNAVAGAAQYAVGK